MENHVDHGLGEGACGLWLVVCELCVAWLVRFFNAEAQRDKE